MNFFFQILVFIFGGPGEAYVESRGTNVSWRPHHTGYICTTRNNNGLVLHICENINIFGYMEARGRGGGGGGAEGASIIRLGPSWFTYTLYLIIIYMSNIAAIW